MRSSALVPLLPPAPNRRGHPVQISRRAWGSTSSTLQTTQPRCDAAAGAPPPRCPALPETPEGARSSTCCPVLRVCRPGGPQDDSLFDDEEAKADPVYSIDLVAFIAERLKVGRARAPPRGCRMPQSPCKEFPELPALPTRQGALSSSAALRDAAGQHLTAMQQASVHRAIAGK